MLRAKENAHSAEYKDARHEDLRRALRSGPQIIRSPAERFRGVLMENKTSAQPSGKNDPEISNRFLKLPDIPAHKGTERERLDKIPGANRARGHRPVSPQDVPGLDD